MACGTPVVGSDVGGIRYSVSDGVTGHLVPPHDPPALARRLMQLQANPALARALGRAGMRRVRSLFTWDRVAGEMAAVYEAVRRPQGVTAIGRGRFEVVPRAGGGLASGTGGIA
jgi:glycosyltransferase involved in cell wall biosynthesis